MLSVDAPSGPSEGERRHPEDPASQEKLRIIQTEVKRLESFLGELRDFLRPAQPTKQEIDLNQVIREVKALMEEAIREKGIRLEDRLNPNLPPVQADPNQLKQVLLNLLGNALRYTPEHGRITLGARLEPASAPMVTVFVSDTGPGIAPDDLPRVFDRFYRADKSRSRATGGSGIGLAIVRQLVHAHGGRVWAESQPGNGATFYFSLPVASQT